MVRFDRFMETALYHPERGYYTSRIQSVGTRGDFTTTAQISDILAKAISKQFLESGYRHLIELGPGTGQLARDVWKQLPFFKRRKSHHHLLEISPRLREQQKTTAPHTRPHKSIQDALQACDGEAFVYSNELVDAFPIRIFRKEEDHWSELYLAGKQPQIHEHFEASPELPHSTQWTYNHPIHQRIEVHESYHLWLREWISHLRRGQILTIDYSTTERPLRHGSLRGYFLHDRLTEGALYQNAGHVDLTADVCFDDLQAWGTELGLSTVFQKSQRNFLRSHITDHASEHYLVDADGAGNAFQVLLQEKRG